MKAWFGWTPKDAKTMSGFGLPCLFPIISLSQLYLILKESSSSSEMLVKYGNVSLTPLATGVTETDSL